MIAREVPEGFVLIAQHDHGLVSGEFARNLSEGVTKGALRGEVLEAIANHDRAWERPDSEVLWNEEAGRPYSFLDHPPEPKTTAYTSFLDAMESGSRYAGLLCSAHYGSLVGNSEDPYEKRFAAREKERRGRIRGSIPDEVLDDFERDFAVLQLCDDLSLFVCLNEPGRNEHPWYKDGLRFLEKRIVPVWWDDEMLAFEPYPFAEEFTVEVPYRVFGRDRREREPGAYRVRVVP
ncbi:MAG: DUF3891 family protein [Rubrobacter sp.]